MLAQLVKSLILKIQNDFVEIKLILKKGNLFPKRPFLFS